MTSPSQVTSMMASSSSGLSQIRDLDVLVGEDQRVAPVHQGLHARDIVAHRVTLALVVVVLPRHPLRLLAGVFDELVPIEPPHDVAVEVHLHQVDTVLAAEGRAALPGAADDVAARQDPVGHAVQPLPQLHLAAVHVDQKRPHLLGLKHGVAVPAPLRVVQGGAGGVNTGVGHFGDLL